MIDAGDLINLIIAPTCKRFKHLSIDLVALIIGTWAQESKLGNRLIQSCFVYGKNNIDTFQGGRGIAQIQKDAHDDIVVNVIHAHEDISDEFHDLYTATDPTFLYNDLDYSCIFTMCQYIRHHEPIPSRTNPEAMAEYYKKYYNSSSGAATTQEFVNNYNTLCKSAVDKFALSLT